MTVESSSIKEMIAPDIKRNGQWQGVHAETVHRLARAQSGASRGCG
jgi:phosphoribosylformimino-5-aminoimidazole carboxamide ribonucleotide (ProFAR) isomerase